MDTSERDAMIAEVFDPRPMLTVRDVCDKLRIRPATLYARVRADESLACRLFGGRVLRFTAAQLERMARGGV
jgi:Helix-turn-helix domain